MKIVAISASQVPSSAANSLQAMKAVHALAQNGHAVTLIVPANGQSPVWDKLAVFYGLHTEFKIEYLSSASRRLFFLSAVRRAKSLQPDLLYVWPLQSAVLGLMYGLPVVLEIHDLPSGRFGPFWYRCFHALKGKKRLVVITAALQRALEERFGAHFRAGDVILAPNGVEPERFDHLPDPPTARRLLKLPEAPTLVCAGHLYAGRGVELFLELAGRLREKNIRFLWVGGRPEDVETWQAQADLKGLTNVTFTGFIHNAQLPLYQAAADILLMPYGREIGISSGGGHSAQISSPMKMFEYLATGRAIIASDLPVFREVLTEGNAVFCPPPAGERGSGEKAGAWEGAILALLDNPQRRLALSRQARADAAQYSWTARAERILDGFLHRER